MLSSFPRDVKRAGADTSIRCAVAMSAVMVNCVQVVGVSPRGALTTFCQGRRASVRGAQRALMEVVPSMVLATRRPGGLDVHWRNERPWMQCCVYASTKASV